MPSWDWGDLSSQHACQEQKLPDRLMRGRDHIRACRRRDRRPWGWSLRTEGPTEELLALSVLQLEGSLKPQVQPMLLACC